jgi:NADH-quinone oxidoreductase subunit M
VAGVARWLQTGYVYHYALVMILGVFVLMAAVARVGRPGWPLSTRRADKNMGWLSLAIWLPILPSAPCCWPLGREDKRRLVRWLALLGAVLSLLVTLPISSAASHLGTAALQFVEKAALDRALQRALPPGCRWHLGVVRAAHGLHHGHRGGGRLGGDHRARGNQYMGAFLILSGLMVGVFAASDGLLFYVFFEATLIPMYIIIGIWGGPRRVYAAFKFFLYTLAGSLLMLVALIYLYYKSGGSFDIPAWHKLPLPMPAQALLFFAFLAAFSVKVPMWPVHTWLPDAHVEAPTGGSVVLAAIMLKLGAYGFLRFSMPIAPDASARVRLVHHRAER